MILKDHSEVIIRQRKEWGEILLDIETRNKYEIKAADGSALGFAAEQGKGFLGFLARGFLGHWRSFHIHFFDASKNLVFIAHHPFRWIFGRLDIKDQNGQKLGAIQQRFSFFRKRFDVENALGKVVLECKSPWFRFWTFPIKNLQDVEQGRIEKKWSGGLKEIFTDADNFRVLFSGNELDGEEMRRVLLAAAIFIDLNYFEKKN